MTIRKQVETSPIQAEKQSILGLEGFATAKWLEFKAFCQAPFDARKRSTILRQMINQKLESRENGKPFELQITTKTFRWFSPMVLKELQFDYIKQRDFIEEAIDCMNTPEKKEALHKALSNCQVDQILSGEIPLEMIQANMNSVIQKLTQGLSRLNEQCGHMKQGIEKLNDELVNLDRECEHIQQAIQSGNMKEAQRLIVAHFGVEKIKRLISSHTKFDVTHVGDMIKNILYDKLTIEQLLKCPYPEEHSAMRSESVKEKFKSLDQDTQKKLLVQYGQELSFYQ